MAMQTWRFYPVSSLSFGFVLWLLVAQLTACHAAEVDSELVGRWQLQAAVPPIYWDIRADGTYAVSGPMAGAGHSGSFKAAAGTWSLHSSTWGDDGGSYRLTDTNTFTGVGRLGPAVWIRVGDAVVGDAVTTPDTAAVTSSAPDVDDIRLSMQSDSGGAVPENLPELLARVRELSTQWRPDSIPVSLEYRYLFAPNPAIRGSEVRISFVSPGDGTGETITVRGSGVSRFVVSQAVRWGTAELPAVFVDLPAAVRIARENGLQGQVKEASLRTWKPGGQPVLAWMLKTGNSGTGRTIDAASGAVLEGDITGYIASYNAQWERAASGLRVLLNRSRGVPQGGGTSFDFSSGDTTPDAPYDDGSSARAEQERTAAEARAYWGGSAEDYNRIKNGECSSSDNSRFGC